MVNERNDAVCLTRRLYGVFFYDLEKFLHIFGRAA